MLFEARHRPCHLPSQHTEETGEKRERNKQEEEAEGGPRVGRGGGRAVLVQQCLWLEGREGGGEICMCTASPKQI